jgi:hypothetical protein
MMLLLNFRFQILNFSRLFGIWNLKFRINYIMFNYK